MFNLGNFVQTFFRPVLLTSIDKSVTPMGTLPVIAGAQGLAAKTISDHFVGIGTVLNEGRIGEEYARQVANKLYEAKLAVDTAISHGWNGGANN